MNKPLLVARGIHRSFGAGRAEVKVLRGSSLEIGEGDFLVIMGSSGCGKSTLLHLLGGLDAPDRGSIEFRGIDLVRQSAAARAKYRNEDAGFVFQFYHLLPELNVLENVLIPGMVRHSYWSWRSESSRFRREALELLDRLGLGARAKHRPRQLSGGEQQRVAIARALIHRPALLLADEPTGNLDEAMGAEILQLLSELHHAGQTIVMVTHDAKVAQRADRRVLLSEGTIKEVTTSRPTAQALVTKVGS